MKKVSVSRIQYFFDFKVDILLTVLKNKMVGVTVVFFHMKDKPIKTCRPWNLINVERNRPWSSLYGKRYGVKYDFLQESFFLPPFNGYTSSQSPSCFLTVFSSQRKRTILVPPIFPGTDRGSVIFNVTRVSEDVLPRFCSETLTGSQSYFTSFGPVL